jgi:hypothetical protein
MYHQHGCPARCTQSYHSLQRPPSIKSKYVIMHTSLTAYVCKSRLAVQLISVTTTFPTFYRTGNPLLVFKNWSNTLCTRGTLPSQYICHLLPRRRMDTGFTRNRSRKTLRYGVLHIYMRWSMQLCLRISFRFPAAKLGGHSENFCYPLPTYRHPFSENAYGLTEYPAQFIILTTLPSAPARSHYDVVGRTVANLLGPVGLFCCSLCLC